MVKCSQAFESLARASTCPLSQRAFRFCQWLIDSICVLLQSPLIPDVRLKN